MASNERTFQNTLDWLLKHSVNGKCDLLDIAFKYKITDIKFLEYLLNNGAKCDKETLNNALLIGITNVEFLKLLFKHGAKCDKDSLNIYLSIKRVYGDDINATFLKLMR